MASEVVRFRGASLARLGVIGLDGETYRISRELDEEEIVGLAEALGLDASSALSDFKAQQSELIRLEVEAEQAKAALRREAEAFRHDPEVQRRAATYRTLVTAQATISHMLDGAEALVRVVAQQEGQEYYPLESAAIWMLQPVLFTIGNHRDFEARDVAWLYEAAHGLLPDLQDIHTAANAVEVAESMGIDERAITEMIRTFNEQAVVARAQGDVELASALAGFGPFVQSMHLEWPGRAQNAHVLES